MLCKDCGKTYKLGESHTINFERFDDGDWVFDYEGQLKEFHIANVLKEAYKNTDTIYIDQLLILISNALQNFDIKDIENLKTDKFLIQKVSGKYFSDAKYEPATGLIKIFINEKCLQDLKDYRNISNIAHFIKSSFTHEDTHRQQDIASNGKFLKSGNYLDFKKDKKGYINQRVEIDAYARQCGFELKSLYPNEKVDDIFKRVFKLDIDDENLKTVLKYLFDNLTVTNQKFFLRNLYDYLEDS